MATTTEEQAAVAHMAADMVVGNERRSHSEGEKKRIKEARAALLLRKPGKALDAMEGDFSAVGSNLRKLGEQFGLGRVDPSTGAVVGRTRESFDRLGRYNAALTEALTFVDLQRGFNSLSPERRNAIREQVKTLLLRDRSALGQSFNQLSEEKRNEAVVKVLQNPGFAKYIREGLTALQGQRFSTNTEQYYSIVSQRNALSSTHSQREELVLMAGGNVAAAEDILSRIRGGATGTGPTTLLNKHRGPQLGEADKAIALLEAQILKTETRRSTLAGLASPSPKELRELKILSDDQAKYAHEIAQLRIANQSKLPSVEDVEDRNLTRRREQIEIQGQHATSTAQLDGLQETLLHMLSNRSIEEESMATNMENVIAQAAYKQILTDLQNTTQVLQEQEHEIAGEERKHIIEGLISNIENTRWRKRTMRKRGLFRRKREELLVDTEKVDRDFDLLLKRGPDVLLRRVLRGVKVPGHGGFPHVLNAHQIDELMEDHDFVHKWGHMAAEQVMAQRSLFRQYRPSEIHHFMNTSWGKEMLHHAYNSNEEYRAQLAALGDAGQVDFYDPSFRAKFAKAAAQNPALLFFPRTTLRWAIPAVAQVVDRPQALAA